MEVIQGLQDYDIRANWKLLAENSFDDYHLISVHASWLAYLRNSGVEMKRPEKGHLLPGHGVGKALGNGHGCTDNVNFRGRPVARWIPIYGEAAKPEIERIRAELVARLGEERAARVADTNRNLFVFPNLFINDGSSVTIRTFYPLARRPHARARVGAGAEGGSRPPRAPSASTAFSPSTGRAASPRRTTSRCSRRYRQGLGTYREVPWMEVTRGMAKEGEQLNTDEPHLRALLDAVG